MPPDWCRNVDCITSRCARKSISRKSSIIQSFCFILMSCDGFLLLMISSTIAWSFLLACPACHPLQYWHLYGFSSHFRTRPVAIRARISRTASSSVSCRTFPSHDLSFEGFIFYPLDGSFQFPRLIEDEPRGYGMTNVTKPKSTSITLPGVIKFPLQPSLLASSPRTACGYCAVFQGVA